VAQTRVLNVLFVSNVNLSAPLVKCALAPDLLVTYRILVIRQTIPLDIQEEEVHVEGEYALKKIPEVTAQVYLDSVHG
jgi:hypothetical protein